MRNRVAVKTDAAIQGQGLVDLPTILDKAAQLFQRPIDIGRRKKVYSLAQTQIGTANLNRPEKKLAGQGCVVKFASQLERMPPK
jgi:hypothetical protein